ncbi:torso-like protein [Anoplophora glabripennis]|uniref:torso-like protein n=1 Tax=Anoplophora glabripennis TaxID=217634 RepID=UPI000873F261|nr:torso-like protein [Anoplophora glabripennis]
MKRKKFPRLVHKVSVAARMWGRAQLLVLLTALTAYGDDDHSELKVGRSIDIFTRYGYLSLSMKVVPRNGTEWIFREPTVNIFSNLDRITNIPLLDRVPKKQKRVFDGDFHMEFCDNVRQLLQAYFRDFSFEKLDKPWRAFTSSWAPEALAKHLGINSSFVIKDHCYVLVRLSRFRETVKLDRIPNNVHLVDDVAKEIDNIKSGDVASVLDFISKYGSHYIHSYVTGNSLYQVNTYITALHLNTITYVLTINYHWIAI